MIKPVNGHLLIDPIKHEGFMSSSRETYEEVGIILNFDHDMALPLDSEGYSTINQGDKVYFDAWLAAKYPKPNGGADDYYWLVKWADVRAIEHVEPTVSE